MMLRLILMRHAKSSWDDPIWLDHQRPLNPRGQKSAKAIGAWLKEKRYIPDQMVGSDAVRVVETFEGLGLECPSQFRRDLFHTGPQTMVEAFERAQSRTILVIGHNPAVRELAGWIVQQAPDHPKFEAYPTAAVLVADFPIKTWREIWTSKAIARNFVVPRDLF